MTAGLHLELGGKGRRGWVWGEGLTHDAGGGHGQAERDVVLVVAHLSQEVKFQLGQDL